MTGLYLKNLQLLGTINLKWPEIVQKDQLEEVKVKPIKTHSGSVTLAVEKNRRTVLLHSKYNPEKEAYNFIKDKGIKEGDTVIVYGFGLGYHIQELLKHVGEQGKVYVIEPNIRLFREALKWINLASFLQDKRLKFILDNNLTNISKKMFELLVELQRKDGQLLIHHPSLELTPDYADSLRQVLLEWQVKHDTLVRFSGQIEENLRQNMGFVRRLQGVTRLLHKFNNIPVLLVAAGPSLDNNIKALRDVKERCLIMAVGTALKPLLSYRITPDLVIITDPHPIVSQQIEGLCIKTPLIAFPTVHPAVLENYPGIKIIAYQQGIDLLETVAREINEELIDTGGSVATSALDIAIRMGCNPIIFIGLDLGYVRGKTHATGTMHGNLNIEEDHHLLEIPNNQGRLIKTHPNLIIIRKWIEQRIEKTDSQIKFFNLSPEGASIKAIPYITWDSVIEKFLQVDQKSVKRRLYKICST